MCLEKSTKYRARQWLIVNGDWLFHIHDQATPNVLSPTEIDVRGTSSDAVVTIFLDSDKQSSARYAGVHRRTTVQTLVHECDALANWSWFQSQGDAQRIDRSVIFRKEHVNITDRICPKGSSAGIAFTHGPILGFSPRRGDTLHRSKWNFAGRSGP